MKCLRYCQGLIFCCGVAMLLIIGNASGSHGPDERGVLEGRVQAANDSPVARAKVMAFRTDQKAELQSTVTDAEGRFSFRVNYGEYLVWSSKEDDGYPDCNLQIFECKSPRVSVDRANPHAEVVVQTAKAVRLTGHITDRASGAELQNASLIVRRADDYFKNLPVTVTSTFSILVPADTELVVTISVFKFRNWDFRDPKTSWETLIVRPGTEAKLDVKMDRVEP
jgi:hypothetical protein